VLPLSSVGVDFITMPTQGCSACISFYPLQKKTGPTITKYYKKSLCEPGWVPREESTISRFASGNRFRALLQFSAIAGGTGTTISTLACQAHLSYN
jgi:hypothetical protein